MNNAPSSSLLQPPADLLLVEDDNVQKNLQNKDIYIKINVGGTLFEVEKLLLNVKDSVFEQILLHNNLHSNNSSGAGSSLIEGTEVYCMDGVYFVNRDPNIFRLIINYLRNPSSNAFPNDSRELLMSVRDESEYFRLHSVSSAIKNAIIILDDAEFYKLSDRTSLAEKVLSLENGMDIYENHIVSGVFVYNLINMNNEIKKGIAPTVKQVLIFTNEVVSNGKKMRCITYDYDDEGPRANEQVRTCQSLYVYNMKQNNVWFSRYEVEVNELVDNSNNNSHTNNNNNNNFNNNNMRSNNGLTGYEKGTIVLVNRDKAVLSWNGKAPDILFFVSLERFVVGLITEDKFRFNM